MAAQLSNVVFTFTFCLIFSLCSLADENAENVVLDGGGEEPSAPSMSVIPDVEESYSYLSPGKMDSDAIPEEEEEEGEDMTLEAIVGSAVPEPEQKRRRQKPGSTYYNPWEALLPWLGHSNPNITLINSTSPLLTNLTEKWTATKISCTPKNVTLNETGVVRIVNSTELLHALTVKNDTQGLCAVVMFYAPWCRFCAKAAPHYNALARAFPQVDILAIDAINFNNLNARFGTIAVPNILVFHNARAVARFNSSSRTLETMINFVGNITGLKGNKSMELTKEDYEGPLSSVPTEEADYLLWISWMVVLGFMVHMTSNTATARSLWQFLASFGQEHNHQHID